MTDSGWAGTGPAATDWTVAGVVRGHAAADPDGCAISTGDADWSWAELDDRSSRVAQALAAAGVGAGDRIAFLDKNGAEYFEVLFGAGKVGAVNVAVNWRLAAAEMQYIVNDAEAKVLVVGPDFVGHLDQMRPGLDTVKTVVQIGGPADTAYEDWLGRQPPADPGHVGAPGDVALQLYTSGTTGLPKGAMLTNANFATIVTRVAAPWQLGASSVNLVAMPLFHIGGSGWALVGMAAGCRSEVVREAVPDALLDLIDRRGVTNAFIVPALLQVLCAVPGAAERDYSDLRAIMYGASPITDRALTVAMETFGCDFVQLYGLTETTGAVTQLDAADHDPGGPRAHLLRSAGRPYPWIDLRVVDPESGEERPRGQVGELWCRSTQNMLGYWNKPDATSAVITPDNSFKTGDAGYMDDEGFVFLTDRIKDMIVSGGENVYPAEVENVVASHPDVADVAVIGVPDPKWGETVKAIVVAVPGSAPDPTAIISFCRERLAHFKCPTSVDFIGVLPRNPSGKILKRELREPYWQGRERRIN
ncbi:MAG TPA: long-chain-fatty-acid--CoA ligase [Acidimicrobiales bacterium]|nr:long-chain-fatty-acid--CoA ligase [Acidimicrobiales bacterium]